MSNVKRYSLRDPAAIVVGRRGEKQARVIEIDITNFANKWPEAEIVLLVKRPDDKEAYPAAISVETGIITWPITGVETAKQGYGSIEIQARVGDVIAKSVAKRIWIAESLTGVYPPIPPEPAQGWVDQVLTAGAEAKLSAAQAGTSAGEAEVHATSADQAETNAQAANTSAQAHANNAQESKTQAGQYASAAQQGASDATAKAQEATTAADQAEQAATDAKASWVQAQEAAAQAQSAAGDALTHRDDARAAAQAAQGYAAQAEVSAAQMNTAIDAAIAPVSSQLAEIMSDVQRIDNALAPISLNINSWKSVQQVVQAGLAPKVFPIGTQLLVSHSVYGDRLYDVVAHDYLKSVHDQNAHTMTILQHDLLPALQFDAPEAFYYAETELPAGTYNFTLAATYSSWLAGTYEFTLAQEVPAGGQLSISGYADADMTARQVRSFASRTTTTVTESVAIISGNGGTNLGTFGEQLNHAHRVSYGSNNYKESAMRQFLNSSAAAGLVWTPQTKFDRPPSWLTSTAGFVAGLDQDFLAVVGDVVLPCSANNTYEAPDSTVVKNTKYTLNEKFYLPSQREVFGVNSDIVADDSVLLPFYDGATAADRIKYRDGSAVTWWLRTPTSWHAHGVRRVNSDGTLNGGNASGSHALAPACTII